MTRPGARTADGLGTIRSQPWRRAAPAVRRSLRADHRRLAPQKKEPHPPMPSPPTPGDGSRHAVPVDRCLVGWWKERREQRQLRHLPSLLVWLQLQVGQANRSRELAQRQAERPIDDRRTTPSRCATRPGRPRIIELQTLEARRIAFCAWWRVSQRAPSKAAAAKKIEQRHAKKTTRRAVCAVALDTAEPFRLDRQIPARRDDLPDVSSRANGRSAHLTNAPRRCHFGRRSKPPRSGAGKDRHADIHRARDVEAAVVPSELVAGKPLAIRQP